MDGLGFLSVNLKPEVESLTLQVKGKLGCSRVKLVPNARGARKLRVDDRSLKKVRAEKQKKHFAPIYFAAQDQLTARACMWLSPHHAAWSPWRHGVLLARVQESGPDKVAPRKENLCQKSPEVFAEARKYV